MLDGPLRPFTRFYQVFSTVSIPCHFHSYPIVHFLCILDHFIRPPLTRVLLLATFFLFLDRYVTFKHGQPTLANSPIQSLVFFYSLSKSSFFLLLRSPFRFRILVRVFSTKFSFQMLVVFLRLLA